MVRKLWGKEPMRPNHRPQVAVAHYESKHMQSGTAAQGEHRAPRGASAYKDALHPEMQRFCAASIQYK